MAGEFDVVFIRLRIIAVNLVDTVYFRFIIYYSY